MTEVSDLLKKRLEETLEIIEIYESKGSRSKKKFLEGKAAALMETIKLLDN